MTVPSAGQAGAEYVGAIAKNAASSFQGVTQRMFNLLDANPLLVVVAIGLVLLLIWLSRPRAN